jgi:chromosome segregation and condensation protein ScpB
LTGRFQGEKPLKIEELREIFKDEEKPKQDYVAVLKAERDQYENKLKELQKKIKVLTAQH